jgi:predicted permease
MYFELVGNSVLPIIALVLIGFILKRFNFPSPEFWQGGEKLSYYVLFPMLFFNITANYKFNEYSFSNLMFSITCSILAVHFIFYFLAFFVKDKFKPALTSVYQGSFRFNGSMAFAMFLALFGMKGQAFIALISCFTIPLTNSLCIYFLAKNGNHGKKVDTLFLVREVAVNPLLVFTLLGFFINLMGVKIPSLPQNIINQIVPITIPFSLIVLGSALKFGHIARNLKGVSLALASKFILYPLIIYLVATQGFGVEGEELKMLMLFSLLPCATAAYLFASKLGGDKDLMASIIFMQLIFSMIFIIIFLKLTSDIVPNGVLV